MPSRTRPTPHTCPYCGHDDDQEAFFHRDDIEAIQAHVLWAAEKDLGHAVEEMARELQSADEKQLLFDHDGVKGTKSPRPSFHRDDLLRDLTCDVCERRYRVYTIALFCPDCGAANLHVHLAREVTLVAQQIEIAQAIEPERGCELAYRLLGTPTKTWSRCSKHT